MGVQKTESVTAERGMSLRKTRRHPRVSLKSFQGEVAGKKRVCRGRIIDASTAGLKIADTDPDFFDENLVYTLILSGKNHNHRLMVTPRWVKKDSLNNSAEVGFRLISAPWEWISFVLDQAIMQDAGIASDH